MNNVISEVVVGVSACIGGVYYLCYAFRRGHQLKIATSLGYLLLGIGGVLVGVLFIGFGIIGV